MNFNFFQNKINLQSLLNIHIHIWGVFALVLIDILNVHLFSSEAYKMPGLW